jgi:transcriptional regulator with GAF, ATPase, and Fis domain
LRSKESLAEAFVQVAGGLTTGSDVVEYLGHLVDRSVAMLEVDAAGLVLADPQGHLDVLACTSEQARLLEQWQLQWHEGPVVDCYRSGRALAVADLGSDWSTRRWPRFGPSCRGAGFVGLLAVPMRQHEKVLGVVNLMWCAADGLDAAAVRIAQALTDVGTVGLVQWRELRKQELLVEQLRDALSSRVVIEQAKGVLAERLGLDPEQAFGVLRGSARAGNYRLTAMARAVIDGVGAPPRARPAPGGRAAAGH